MKIWLAWGLQSLDISAANHPAVHVVMVLKVTRISWKLGLACEAEDTAICNMFDCDLHTCIRTWKLFMYLSIDVVNLHNKYYPILPWLKSSHTTSNQN